MSKKDTQSMPTLDGTILDRLYAQIEARRGADPQASYTAKLLQQGRRKIAQKLGEEAVETVIEAIRGDKDKLVSESADLLYHLLVVWLDAGVEPEAIYQELHRREGISGIAEKHARPKT